MDLREAEDMKKRWLKYREESYKNDLHDTDNHDGVITHLVPDILECEVKWALGSLTRNKTGGGDGISVELFQIQDFPGGSAGKASVYNVGGPCSIPG